MEKILETLKGKKTFIIAFSVAFFNLCLGMGWITLDPNEIIAINGFLGSLGLTTLRIGLNGNTKK